MSLGGKVVKYLASDLVPSQHRVSPFRLADPSKPGHRRFIALWLVDPHKRIISTANVPPQRLDWCAESLLGATSATKEAFLSRLPAELAHLVSQGLGQAGWSGPTGKLPNELKEMIRSFFEKDGGMGLMSEDEAKDYRLKLMADRTSADNEVDGDWHENTYNFCEH
jgi:hypothetical protein